MTLAEAKAFLRVEHDDDDDVIAALIAGARIHVEAQTRRALITQSWRLVARRLAGGRPHRRAAGAVARRSTAARVYRLDGTHAGDRLAALRRRDRGGAGACCRLRRGRCRAPGAARRRHRARRRRSATASAGRRAGAAAPGDPAAGRALVREPRPGRGRPGDVAVLPPTVRGADRALPGAVAMTPGAGELNRRLTLEAPVESADGAGGVTRSYATVDDRCGPRSSRCRRAATVAADALGATVTHRIVIRGRADITHAPPLSRRRAHLPRRRARATRRRAASSRSTPKQRTD